MSNRIVRRTAKPPADVVEAFTDIGSTEVSDVVDEHNTMDPGIRAVTETDHVCGTAVTVRLRDENNSMVNVAYDLADSGDVVVIETDGMARAAWGDTYINTSTEPGVAGGVVDGYVRDIGGFDEAGFPVFSRGATPRGPLNDGSLPGSVNVPVTVGGVTVRPGDIVVGDEDGVAVVPQERATKVLDAARKSLTDLAHLRERLDDGEKPFLELRGVADLLEDVTQIDEKVDYGARPYPESPDP
ncbi:MAG: RraA family protein [Halobacteriota archaeon]